MAMAVMYISFDLLDVVDIIQVKASITDGCLTANWTCFLGKQCVKLIGHS